MISYVFSKEHGVLGRLVGRVPELNRKHDTFCVAIYEPMSSMVEKELTSIAQATAKKLWFARAGNSDFFVYEDTARELIEMSEGLAREARLCNALTFVPNRKLVENAVFVAQEDGPAVVVIDPEGIDNDGRPSEVARFYHLDDAAWNLVCYQKAKRERNKRTGKEKN